MKIIPTKVKSIVWRTYAVIGAAALFSAIPNTTNAAQTVRDLWDGLPKAPMAGRGSDPSSVGLDASTTWVVNPPGNTGLSFDSSWDLYDYFGFDSNTVLTPTAGSGGTLAYYGGNMGSLTNPATTLPYGNYYSQCYATRALATNAYINFQANGTYYFSVRMIKGVSWWTWNGDNGGGIGFASSGATNAHFIGAGITRNSPFIAADGITDIGSTAYITTGTLDQAGTGFNIDPNSGLDTDGGPYRSRAAGTVNELTDLAGLLVGKLTTTTSGASTMSVKLLTTSAAVPADPSSITWDATYGFTETNVMTQLLVWQYGTGPSVQDALRVGTTWSDAVGLELVGPIKASPGSTVYAGSTVTLSQNAGLNTTTYPMTFQWFSNSIPLTDATNSSLVLTNPTVDFTADYSIVANNFFGSLSNLIHVTINPAVAPFFTLQPVTPIVRYVGGTATFTAGVDGTPPFDLQLKHAGTNVPGATAHLLGPGTVTLSAGPLTLADGTSSYSVTATNLFGMTNSQSASVTLITPPPGSFEEAAVTNGAAAVWKLSETTNSLTSAGVPLKDYMSGLDGLVPSAPSFSSVNNVGFGLAGPSPLLPGFAGITSLKTFNNGLNSQINLPSVPYSNSMTMVCWMNGSFISANGIMFDLNKDSGNAHYGIHYFNSNLGSQWGDAGSSWNSGITLPLNQWVMVALVVAPNETTIYAGTDPLTLQVMNRSTVEGTNFNNVSGTLSNGRLALGRSDWGWAQNDNAWGGMNAQFCNAAIFYKALTPTAITNLYVAGFGTGFRIAGKPDSSGNLILNWYPNIGLILQEANSPNGPWSDDVSSPTPPYTVPIAPTNQFYRLRQ